MVSAYGRVPCSSYSVIRKFVRNGAQGLDSVLLSCV